MSAEREGVVRRIAISATFTAEPLLEVLDFWMRELDLPARVELAPYHQVFQQLLDPGSLLRANQHGVNVVLVRLEDWLRDGESDGGAIERCASDLTAAIEEAATRGAAPLLVSVCPGSPGAAAGGPWQAASAELEQRLRAIASEVPNLHLAAAAELRALYPVEPLHDRYADRIGHVPYTPAGFAALGTLISRKIHALSSPPAKVIALDCDQTLWRGVCGEDGPDGVVLDEPQKRLQELVLAQREAGMLLCLCSKNNENEVWNTFDRRPDFPLGRRHLTAWRINWSPKSESLRSLAAELGLGLDSFVLIDDNPVECAEVRASCPQVMVLELPADQRQIPGVLAHYWAFDRMRTTAADRGRADLYRQQQKRERHRQRAATFEEFLAGLEMVVDVLPLVAEKQARAAQLTQRTNQFNASTIRRTEAEIRQLLASGSLEGRAVEVRDRFGDYGMVGAVLFTAGREAIEVDSFLLSCRALGRGVEHRMLSDLALEADRRGLTHVDVRVIPTARNRPALDFLRGVPGAAARAAAGEGFVLRLPAVPVAMPRASIVPAAPGEAMPEAGLAVPDAGAAPAAVDTEGAAREDRSSLLLRIAAELSDPLEVRRRLQAMRTGSRQVESGAYVAPQGPVEEQLQRIFAEVMGVERVGSRDDFFTLGVHSLPALQAMSRIRDVFGVELTLRSFFAAPTLAGLAAEIEVRRPVAGALEQPAIASFGQEGGSPPPLTFAQEQFWSRRQLEARTVASTIPVLLRFAGRLEIACLRLALQAMVDRHEALRTSFREVGEGPVQVVHAALAVHLPVVDLRRLTAREAGEVGQAMAEVLCSSRRDARAHFDLEGVPLFRLALFRCSEREHLLLFTVHHIVFDGWSYPVLVRELSAGYNAISAGRRPLLPALTVQCRDLARRQRRSGEALARHTAYWREQLRGAGPLDLGGDRPRPSRRTFAAGIETIAVPKELERRLAALAAGRRVTLFMILLAAFNALLHGETEQDDLVVTGLFANRNQIEIEGLIGNFFVSLPLRTRLRGLHTFDELLAQVRDLTLAAHEHADVPAHVVMERTGSREPFRILFQLQQLPSAEPAFDGLEVTRLPVDTGRIGHDLGLVFFQSDRLEGRFRYNLDVLDAERIVRMRDRLLAILAAAAAAPGGPLASLVPLAPVGHQEP